MRCALYLHRNTPPFAGIREIRTATNIDRVRAIDSSGELHFQVALADAYINEGLMSGTASEDGFALDADLIREGSAIVDYSTEMIPPTLWYVLSITFDAASGQADVRCAEWRRLLEERLVPAGSSGGSRAPAVVARGILAAVNGRNPTHIRMAPAAGAFLRLVQAADRGGFAGRTVARAFDSLALQTNSEWYVQYHIGWRHIEACLQWAYRVGGDKRGVVHLTEGVHLTSVTYQRDAREVPRVIRFVQGATGPAGAVATSGQYRGDPGGFDTPPEADRRRLVRTQHGPALQTEILRVNPSASDDIGLVASALRNIQTPIVAFQAVELTIRNGPAVVDDNGAPWAETTPLWRTFALGDIVTVRLSSPHFLAGVDLDTRVKAIQPDEAAGSIGIVAEVVA